MTKRVNPIPSVPATPAKQNPNPTDNVRRKPDDQGFQSILDKYTGGSKKGQDMPDSYRAGGTASARADGCAMRGKTKGRFIQLWLSKQDLTLMSLSSLKR